MRRTTELVCNWQGFAGCSDPCGELLRLPFAPRTVVHLSKTVGWGFRHDTRSYNPREAKDLDPDRPEFLILCPPHERIWGEWFGPHTALSEARAAELVEAFNARQTSLFPDDDRPASTGANLHGHDTDTKG